MVNNRVGMPYLPDDPCRVLDDRRRMSQPTYVLASDHREIVARAIRDHATHRGWRVLALNVRSTHVHLGLSDFGDYSPEEVMKQCKSWGTRRLIVAGFADSWTRVWSDHGSTRYLNTAESVNRMVDYITNWQDDRPEWR
jgi:REP element-mobilizing transposase RayT